MLCWSLCEFSRVRKELLRVTKIQLKGPTVFNQLHSKSPLVSPKKIPRLLKKSFTNWLRFKEILYWNITILSSFNQPCHSKPIWLSSFEHRRENIIYFLLYCKLRKWWQNGHFRVNYSFKAWLEGGAVFAHGVDSPIRSITWSCVLLPSYS